MRPRGQQGPLVAYDAATGARRFELGPGMLAADGRHFVTARRNVVRVWSILPQPRLVARWVSPRTAWLAAVSADARRVVVNERSPRGHTRFALVDTVRRRIVARGDLRGSYQPEALSPNARRLYLIHWLPRTYELSTYDFRTRALRPTRLAEPDEKMTGTAFTAVATRDGRWLLTLYVGGGENGAFVHALDLRSGVAHCVDLPWQVGDFNNAGTTALALSPDGTRLYLGSPLLGRFTVVDVARSRVVRTVRFRPVDATRFPFGVGPDAAVSAHGRVVALAGGGNVWFYDTAYGTVRGPVASGRRLLGVAPLVNGIGFTPDGRRLLALLSGGGHVSYDTSTARRVHAPTADELFLVRTGVGGSVSGYEPGGGLRFVLPPGRASADGRSYFSAVPRQSFTYFRHYDAAEARLVGSRLLDGLWGVGAVSASGRVVALAQHERGSTRVRVVDPSGRTLANRTLHGVYTLDAITDDAQRLFLIQHHRSGRYAVRALSLRTGRIRTATLREKGKQEQPLMTGHATAQVASRDGRWLLTLYLNTKEHKAFVHALDLKRAVAVCVDLPGAGRERVLRDYSLALSPTGDVYASNATLGVVARVDLHRESVVNAVRFRGTDAPGGWAASALSRSGRRLYFTSGRKLWRLDTVSQSVRGPTVTRAPVLGLAFSRDGRNVFAAQADGVVTTLAA
jgi:hypothetical protein